VLHGLLMDVTAIAQTTTSASGLANPGKGAAPPGSAGLITVMTWASDGALAIGIVGMISTGAQMVIASRRGEGGGRMAHLGWVFGGSRSHV
jgi:hypothetical protein